jgi:hypothetical protein
MLTFNINQVRTTPSGRNLLGELTEASIHLEYFPLSCITIKNYLPGDKALYVGIGGNRLIVNPGLSR